MPAAIETDTCRVEDCTKPRQTVQGGKARRSLCAAHQKRREKHGDEQAHIPVKERAWDGTYQPKGSLEISYHTAHARVRHAKGPAKLQTCVDCDEQAADWSYDGGCPNELSSGVSRWSPDVNCYSARCKSCHLAYDRRRSS